MMHVWIISTEVEAEVLDKMKYIEETKETMEDYTKKLVVVLKDIKGIEPGKTHSCSGP